MKKPDNTSSLSNRSSSGVADLFQEAFSFFQKGDLLKARELCKRILQCQPNHFDALHVLGVAAWQTGDYTLSLNCFQRAIELQPDNPQIYFNYSGLLNTLKRREEALQNLDKVIELQPDYAEAYSNRGVLLHMFGRCEEALASYNKAIALKPDYASAYSNRGNVCYSLNRLEEALASCNKAIELEPNYADAFTNRGNVYTSLNRLEEALASYNKAIELKPDYADIYSNRGNVYHILNRQEEALASHNKAIELQPDYAEAYSKRSVCYLILGELEKGWQDYEWRWKEEKFKANYNDFGQKLWLGKESIAGKVILLHAEQGLGDTLQFCRYAPLLSERGATVLLEVPQELVSLLTTLQGVSQIIAKGTPLPAFDYHCPLLSLPLAFNTELGTIPHKTPYLFSTEEKRAQWASKLGVKRMPRIGLVWSGNPLHTNDHNRSLTLELLLQAMPAGVQCISLQKNLRAPDLITMQNHPDFLHFEEELTDFADSAALCDLLDLIISVDTSAVHLAGSMNKPTWTLLPFVPDWRWLLNRQDSPWYPGMTLYRQPSPGDWNSVLAKVTEDLSHLFLTPR